MNLPNNVRAYRWRQKHPELRRLSQIRNRAKVKGFDFNLTVEDLNIPEKCSVLGIDLKQQFNNKQPDWDSPSVDRIDNTKGYVKDNVRIISKRANTLKSNATIEELELILADLRRINHGDRTRTL